MNIKLESENRENRIKTTFKPIPGSFSAIIAIT